MTATRLWRLAVLVAAGSVVLTGCKFEGAASFPLPGGEATGSDAYEVTVEYTDVLDLVRQSAVKVDDVTVGSVSDISLDGFTARVKVRVRPDVVLPANARASLRQTSLLGEKFVSLDRPTDEPARGRLRDGDLIPLARTVRGTEIEEVLSALSLVLNGGSLEQLQTINRELVNALEGRESEIKDVLTQLDTFVGGLDEQKQQIVRALDGLDRLTARLADQRQTFAVALRDIPRGSAVLTEQRQGLVQVLQGLDRLGDVATRVISASQRNTVADLRALEPILRNLNEAGRDLPRSLELLTTYPFPRTVSEGIKGDYANLFLTVDANLLTLENNTGLPLPVPSVPVPLPTLSVPPLPGGGIPRAPAVPSVPVPVPTGAPLLPKAPGVPGPLSADRSDLLGLLLGGLT
ncbi:MAG: mammalian cell entry protein [Frankiales bacterium]|jgi:phospholipid/cholesterol/gamma-HCH transport system substrate-binding protein|nr:mammalian cell entry protein [Frankiales bacterium]